MHTLLHTICLKIGDWEIFEVQIPKKQANTANLFKIKRLFLIYYDNIFF